MLDQLQPVGGLGPVGEIRLVPDPQTFTVLPYAPNAAAMDGLVPDGPGALSSGSTYASWTWGQVRSAAASALGSVPGGASTTKYDRRFEVR